MRRLLLLLQLSVCSQDCAVNELNLLKLVLRKIVTEPKVTKRAPHQHANFRSLWVNPFHLTSLRRHQSIEGLVVKRSYYNTIINLDLVSWFLALYANLKERKYTTLLSMSCLTPRSINL